MAGLRGEDSYLYALSYEKALRCRDYQLEFFLDYGEGPLPWSLTTK